MALRRFGPVPAIVLLAIAAGMPLAAQKRPEILGIAHVSLRTNDLEAARKFYGDDLGFEEPFPWRSASGAPGAIFKVNERQYIEVSQELKDDSQDRLIDLAFETADARGLRDYLAARHFAVPANIGTDRDGNLSFMVNDPGGRAIEFVQYLPDSAHGRQKGKFLGEHRISNHIIHSGFTVLDRETEDRFYRATLGFDEMWHGGRTDTSTDWIDMRVPDGDDWLEYMLNPQDQTSKTRGRMHHLALGVESVNEAYQQLVDRGVAMGEMPKTGRDGKWQLNLYDHDLTRTELMEPKPVQKPCCSEFHLREQTK